jgi:broad specificity phosphatase PhoE
MAEPGRYYAHSQVALSSEGVKQAELLRDRLTGERIDVICSSDLDRARVTAEIIATTHRLKVVLCPEMRELDFGALEGMSLHEIEQIYPEAVELWNGCDLDAMAPGGESLRQLACRVERFLARLRKRPPEETALAVAHAGPLRVLICILLGIDLRRQWQIRLDLASLSLVEWYPEGTVISFLNDTSHLKPLMGPTQSRRSKEQEK